MSENLLVNYYNVIPFNNSSELLDIFEKAQNNEINENEFNLKYLMFIKNIKTDTIYSEEYEEDYINKITGLFYCQAIYSDFNKFIKLIHHSNVNTSFKKNMFKYVKNELNDSSEKHIKIVNSLKVKLTPELCISFINDNLPLYKYDPDAMKKILSLYKQVMSINYIDFILKKFQISSELEKLVISEFKLISSEILN